MDPITYSLSKKNVVEFLIYQRMKTDKGGIAAFYRIFPLLIGGTFWIFKDRQLNSFLLILVTFSILWVVFFKPISKLGFRILIHLFFRNDVDLHTKAVNSIQINLGDSHFSHNGRSISFDEIMEVGVSSSSVFLIVDAENTVIVPKELFVKYFPLNRFGELITSPLQQN